MKTPGLVGGRVVVTCLGCGLGHGQFRNQNHNAPETFTTDYPRFTGQLQDYFKRR